VTCHHVYNRQSIYNTTGRGISGLDVYEIGLFHVLYKLNALRWHVGQQQANVLPHATVSGEIVKWNV